MAQTKRKPKKNSLLELMDKYHNNPDACYQFFYQIKYPDGYFCEKCGCTHYYKIKRGNVLQCAECMHQQYLFANTIFQDNKLDHFKLILGLYLFFSSNKGISALEMASQLEVNYKTALLLCRKCRILMASCNSEKILDNLFYEVDVAYIGSKSKEKGRQGCGTEQQPFFIAVSTDRENQYPQYMKLHVTPTDNSELTKMFIMKSIKLSKERTLNTDGKTTFDCLKEDINVVNEKINYDDKNHRLYWLNVLVGDIKNNINGIYHGVAKRDLHLFLNEQEWRYNHRYTGKNLMDKIMKYIHNSFVCPRKLVVYILNKSVYYYSPACV